MSKLKAKGEDDPLPPGHTVIDTAGLMTLNKGSWGQTHSSKYILTLQMYSFGPQGYESS